MLSTLQRLFSGDDQAERAAQDHNPEPAAERWPVLSRLFRRDRSDLQPPSRRDRTTPAPNDENLDDIFRRVRTDIADHARLQHNPRHLPVSAADASARAEIANDYVRLVEQTLHHATRTILSLTNQPAGGQQLATMAQWLCRCLLAHEVDASHLAELLSRQTPVRDRTALDDVLIRLCDDVAALRSRVHTETHRHHWSFAASLGLTLDPDRQQPWRRSDPHLPVNGVVAPALIMDGRIFCKQWVTTGPPIG